MNIIKKQGIGFYLTLLAVVMAIVSFIVYLVNGASEGYFQGTTSNKIVLMSVLAIVLALASIVVAQLQGKSLVGRIIGIVSGACRIAAAALLIASLVLFIGDRAQGLAYIYFSDENVLAEVQTAANMKSASTAITGFVLYGIAWFLAVVASFFKIVRK